MKITTLRHDSQDIEREWRALGFVDGAPAHVPPLMVRSDKRIYRHCRCQACGHRGQQVRPFHRGREYRLLLRCRSCGAGGEA